MRKTLFERMSEIARTGPAVDREEKRLAELEGDDWQDHCDDPACEDCPPGPPNVQL